MPSEIVIASANLLQGLVPVLSLTAYIPQWKKLLHTKSSKDISLRAWLIWSVSGSIAVYYAVVQYLITGKGMALVFSSVAILSFVLITVFMVLHYRSGNGTSA